MGRRVRILAISPIAHCSPDVPPDQVDTYDPHIVGKVVGVRETRMGGYQAKIANLCNGNAVVEVELDFPDLREALMKKTICHRTTGRRRGGGVRPDGHDGQDGQDGLGGTAELSTLVCVRPWPMNENCTGPTCTLTAGPAEFMYI